MNIIVCIKQVPGTSQVEIDPETGMLQRSGVEAKLNPHDLYALEYAFLLKETYGGHVTALTMGPPAARDALCEALYMGADEGVLLTDKRFAGADVVATSFALAQGIGCVGEYDLILCGKQTTDGDTAQVGPEIAEFLGIPHCAGVLEILEVTNTHITFCAALERSVQRQRIALPALLCTQSGTLTPRLPSYKRKKALADPPIRTLGLENLACKDPAQYGLAGSPTQVERIFPPEVNDEQCIISGDAAALAGELLGVLAAHRLGQEHL